MNPRPPKMDPPRGGGTAFRANERWLAVGICALLVALIWFVFGRTMGFEFVNFDDDFSVYANPHVSQGLTGKGVVWAFTHAEIGNWIPLTVVSHMIDCQLFGLRAGGHHLMNVLLHAVAAVLLFLVLRAMTGALGCSAFVAAVFAIHPLRVESVAWVTERKDVLSGVFFMLTLAAYLRYVRRPFSWGRYLSVFGLFALGLMAKPILVTLPFLLLLLDGWPLRRWGVVPTGRLIVEKIPLLVLSTGACLATMALNPGITAAEVLPLPIRLGNTVIAYATYLRQTIWPAGLAALYPYPMTAPASARVALDLGLLVAISVLAVVFRHRHPYVLTGWFWYLGLLVPVIGIVQAGSQAYADRYTYLPQIGLSILVAWTLTNWAASRRPRLAALGAGAIFALAALTYVAREQTGYWRNLETLWARALAVTGPNPQAHTFVGMSLAEKGRFDEAIEQYRKALEISPDAPETLNVLGTALFHRGREEEAISTYRKALQFKPESAEFHNNLGNALQKVRVEEAIKHYGKALQIQPEYADAHNNLGNVLFQKGDFDGAIRHLQMALDIQPNYPAARVSLGNALLGKGRTEEAIRIYTMALSEAPNNAAGHVSLGVAFATEGRLEKAQRQFLMALEIEPGNIDVRYNLSNLLLQRGRPDEAISHLVKVLSLQPNFVMAQNLLAWTWATSPDAGVRNGRKALEVAERANQLTGGRNPMVLRVLAAAQAEDGHPSEAAATADRALSLIPPNATPVLARALQTERDLYAEGKPFRDASNGTASPP